MTRIVLGAAIIAGLMVPSTALAQNPYTDSIKAQLAQIKNPVIRTAEKVGEDLYAFKPTPEVRSLGQLIAHIADGNFGICAAASGMKPPMSGVEKSTQGNGKAALQKALAASFEFCEQGLAAMDDKKGAEVIKMFLGMQPRLGVFAFNNSHVNEHYGNLVTYMRLKGIVPPSSEPQK
ncbi:MAG TPA: DinB family protein [Vicinamibacterales bacterium]